MNIHKTSILGFLLLFPNASFLAAETDWIPLEKVSGLMRRAERRSGGAVSEFPEVRGAPVPIRRMSDPAEIEERNRKEAIATMRKSPCGKIVLMQFKDTFIVQMPPDHALPGNWFFSDPGTIAELKDVAKETGHPVGDFPQSEVMGYNLPDGKSAIDLPHDALKAFLEARNAAIADASKRTLAQYNAACRES